MFTQETERLNRDVVEFCRFARARGFSAGTEETLSALEASRVPGVAGPATFPLALRAVLCSSKEEWDQFDELLRAFRNEAHLDQPAAAPKKQDRKSDRAETERPTVSSQRALVVGTTGQRVEEGGGRAVLGASAQERLRKTDFSLVPAEDAEALDRLSLRLFRRMALRISRVRHVSNSRSGAVDLRGTIRRAIPRGGELIELKHRVRKRKPGELVILLDVSGSMNPYSLFLLRFAYALQKHSQRVRTFLFSTQLVDVTESLKARTLAEALTTVSRQNAGWSGGTKIGESLQEFHRAYGERLLSRNAVLLILSDGWDTGKPEILAGELELAARRVGKLIWLNPLLGLEGYEPVTRAMNVALPFIDVFAPAHNLESLLALEHHLAVNRDR